MIFQNATNIQKLIKLKNKVRASVCVIPESKEDFGSFDFVALCLTDFLEAFYRFPSRFGFFSVVL